MHAVIGVWSMDESRHEEQMRTLRGRIVPEVSALPGLAAAYCAHDPETGKYHTTVVFADESSAAGFKQYLEGQSQAAAQAGVTADTLALAEVVAATAPEGEQQS
ncbi:MULTISPECIES: hypothetical protein [Streptomyces]|uniref:Antibiotic biosynthesis monooxygenase n=2 Tax=Streptomyces TaxID=1883 RepID=A0A2U9NVA1_STRAS|nr:hypothetical protein [Streptomyces actuosus]AWT41166.1 hypothetical protein DMT42_01710 [Streptomyces actuosus]MBM4826316.1 hypothetical protein [Streptomyces actuosus]